MTPTETGIAPSAAVRDAGGVSGALAAALARCADSILVTDARGRVVWVSPSAEAMSGYRADELLGWPVAELFPGGRAEARAVMRRLAREEHVRGYLTTFPGAAGRRIPVSASMALLRDGDGTVTGTVGILRDITEEVRRAAGLTGQLLAFSRQQVVEPAPLRLASVIDGMAPALQRLLGNDIELTLRHDPALRTVMADPGQLEQVVMSLTANARDAMPNGGRLTITTANVALDAAALVRLEVADTGAGMDEAVRARIFEPFFTTKRPGEGTGLGLAIVDGIVTQSGGAVRVTSSPGRGTVVTVDLPARPETVLLVEDDADVRGVARETLLRHGYVVLEAPAPADALRLATTNGATIDLLLTDVRMPEMSGPALAERLTALLPKLRVLYMSGFTDNALTPGDALIDKPFAPAALARRVREVLDTPLS